MLTFNDLQNEVKRRAIRNESGTQFDTAVKNILNTSLFRVAREASWRALRKTTYFDTVTTNDTGSGSGSFTNDSTSVIVTSASWVTDDVRIGRRIKLSGDSTYHTIRSIANETRLNIETGYSGTSTTSGTYSILGQEEYNVPIQACHRLFLWHEEYGFPFKMSYITDQEFYESAWDNTSEAVPEYYRMWGTDMVIEQPRQASVLAVSSSASGDTSKGITIFGTVSGYPDSETINTNAADGTTTATGNKSFSEVERVVKNSTTTGRITVTANGAEETVAVMPVGDTTAGIMYAKIQLYPLPDTSFPINVWYYKDPHRMVEDSDVHDLGQEFDEAIILLSVAKLNYENSKREGDRFYALYKDEINSLKKTNVDKIDFFPKLKRPRKFARDRVAANLMYRQVGPYYGPSSRF